MIFIFYFQEKLWGPKMKDHYGHETILVDGREFLSLGPQYSSMQCQKHKYSSIFWIALMYICKMHKCKTRGISLLSVILYRKKIMINCQYFVMQMRFSNQTFSLISWHFRQVVRQVFTKTGLFFAHKNNRGHQILSSKEH